MEQADKYINKARKLIIKVVNNKRNLTAEQIQDIRLDIDSISFLITEEVLGPIQNEAAHAEMDYEDTFTQEFGKFYKMYIDEKDENDKNKYTRSSAESFARNTCKLKKIKGKFTPCYLAKKKAAEKRNYEKQISKLLRAMEKVSNSLAAISKK